jgi:hypothetical protein|tara:strand:+ start:3110 stop:3292 length:183 start_codon:yes stop_codon:yes gene_type:complete
MGVLVSLCDYRESLRKEEEARTQEEIDQLKILVRAWANALGDPEVKPYYLPLEEHLTEST